MIDYNITLVFPGELGWEIMAPPGDMLAVYSAIVEAGQEMGCGDFGTYAMNSLRLEKGFRGWGAEVSARSIHITIV